MDTQPNQATPDDLDALASQAGAAARLLKLLANERRLLILCGLARTGEMSVSALAAEVGLSQSALSQHLSRMRDEGLVGCRRNGVSVHYSIADPTAKQLLATLKDLYCAPTANTDTGS